MKTDNKPTILYLTDLYFEAKGRNYYEEDLYLTGRLRDDFAVVLAHPVDSQKFEQIADILVFRNTGPTMNYKSYFKAFTERVDKEHIRCYNSMKGKADTQGKDYLIELSGAGFPVIPTIENRADLHLLPLVQNYIIKLKDGADSIGMRIVNEQELADADLTGKIVQPFIDFSYEVSFYYIDQHFQYALYAPDKTKRWNLEKYEPTIDDIIFADQFIKWNNLSHGIQRVDACRTANDDLLLVELEDLNPYLSIDLLDDDSKESFVLNFKKSINAAIQDVSYITRLCCSLS